MAFLWLNSPEMQTIKQKDMHGHRHIDWIGACGAVKIVSAPSPVMGATDDAPTHFHIHTLSAAPDGRLYLLPPECIEIAGVEARSAG
jgi:hypothetical protein